ncbi:hypothetical protein DM860_015932 [Cuscuta australis]|uniref:Uncharacterized protein n=1 Tax=Cuscuta australis TaxID=267555 RepID=A0A328DYJ4_9ASTE|nr:hypothetical protein DM860_015932 [Cuscuta australis]
MMEALIDVNDTDADIRKKGCELFFFHITETVRFIPIRHQVYLGLVCSEIETESELPDKNCCFKWFASSPNANDLEEVRMLLAPPVFEFCYRDEVETFPYIGNFVSNWDRLSKVWALYSATGNHYFDKDGESELMRSCRIGGIDSLRNSLGLLKKVKLEELGPKVAQLKL